jgi:hypothetical protein
MFFFKKKTTKLNYQPAQYEKKKLKLTKIILEKKTKKNKKKIIRENTVVINKFSTNSILKN